MNNESQSESRIFTVELIISMSINEIWEDEKHIAINIFLVFLRLALICDKQSAWRLFANLIFKVSSSTLHLHTQATSNQHIHHSSKRNKKTIHEDWVATRISRWYWQE